MAARPGLGGGASFLWVSSELEITQGAHGSREDRSEFRGVSETTGIGHTKKQSFAIKTLLLGRWNRSKFRWSSLGESRLAVPVETR